MNRPRTLLSLALAASILLSTAPSQAADGKALYEGTCGICHGPSGQGAPGMFPPLASRLAPWFASAQGREYIGQVVLNGYFGQIEVDGASYNGFMPPAGHLPAADLAAILDYLGGTLNTPADGYRPISADELTAWKAAPKRDTVLKALRDGLPVKP